MIETKEKRLTVDALNETVKEQWGDEYHFENLPACEQYAWLSDVIDEYVPIEEMAKHYVMSERESEAIHGWASGCTLQENIDGDWVYDLEEYVDLDGLEEAWDDNRDDWWTLERACAKIHEQVSDRAQELWSEGYGKERSVE